MKLGANSTSNPTVHSTLGTSSRRDRRSNQLVGIGNRRSTKFEAMTSSKGLQAGSQVKRAADIQVPSDIVRPRIGQR